MKPNQRKKFIEHHKDFTEKEVLIESLWKQQIANDKLERTRSNTSILVWCLFVIPFLLGFLILFAGCSKDSPEEIQKTKSSITYLVEGTSGVEKVSLTTNSISGDKDPRSGSVKSIEVSSFPFEYTIDEYWPNWAEIVVTHRKNTYTDKVSSITIMKDGLVVARDTEFSKTNNNLSNWPDGTSTYRVIYEWGVFLDNKND